MDDKGHKAKERLLPPLKRQFFTLDPGEETLPSPPGAKEDPEEGREPITLPRVSVARRTGDVGEPRREAERRKDPRVPLQISCLIHEGLTQHQTQTCNASLKGFCAAALEGISLRLGHLYQITLSDGQQRSRFKARLVRVDGDKVGFVVHEMGPIQERLYGGILMRCAYQTSPAVGALFRKLLAKRREEKQAVHD